jgi:o-succinylbenzoate---CoA ligase
MKKKTDHHIFLSDGENNFTFSDLYQSAASMRHAAEGTTGPYGLLTEDKKFAVLMIAAAWLTGKTIVPLPATQSVDELHERIGLSGIKSIISAPVEKVGSALHGVKSIEISYSEPGSNRFEHQITDENNVFAIMFTSGTAGKPKAVPLLRRQMISAANSSKVIFEMLPDELWLHCLPLHHIGGVGIILRSVLYGSGMYLTPGFDVHSVAKLISGNTKIKAASLVPTMLKRLLDLPDFTPHTGFRAALIGGGPSSPELQSRVTGKIPAVFSYGMTETCAQIASTSLERGSPNSTSLQSYNATPGIHPVIDTNSHSFELFAGSTGDPESAETPASQSKLSGSTKQTVQELKTVSSLAGKLFPPNKIKIIGPSGENLPIGQSGIICLMGPQVFEGYLHSTESCFTHDGWFVTGDHGFLDEQGFLFLESRRDDRIVTGGENVDPAEVESALMQLPEIREAAVIGLPDDHWGQIVTAIIVPEPDVNCSLDVVRNRLRTKLATYKIPRQIKIVSELPRTELGKIKKALLRDLLT